MPIPAAVPMILGGIGSLAGMLKNRSAPTMSDVNLQRDNPELWKELQQLQAMTQEYERLYARRQQGATTGELAGQAQARSSMNEQMGNLGLVGSSAGAGMMGRFEAEQQNALQQRIFQEQAALLAAQQQAQQGYIQNLGNAQNAALAALSGQHQDRLANDAAQNQFFGGLVNAGLNLYGTNEYLNTMRGPTYQGFEGWNNNWGNPNKVDTWR